MDHFVVYMRNFKLLNVENLAQFHLSWNTVGVVEFITKILHPMNQLAVLIRYTKIGQN
jgi:hypothetical protein